LDQQQTLLALKVLQVLKGRKVIPVKSEPKDHKVLKGLVEKQVHKEQLVPQVIEVHKETLEIPEHKDWVELQEI
jgi:hypothetical protein